MLGINQLSGFGAMASQDVNLVTNGDFAAGTTGWSFGTGWSASGGAAVHGGATGGALTQASLFSIGTPYRITFDATVSGTLNLWVAGTEVIHAGITSGAFSKVWNPSTAGSMYFEAVGSAAVTLDNVVMVVAVGRGAELVTNGYFVGGSTGWSVGTGWSVSGEAAVHAGSGGNLTQATIFTSGTSYEIRFDATVSGTLNVWINGSQLVQASVTSGAFSRIIKATTTGSLFFEAGASASVTLDNISVKEVI